MSCRTSSKRGWSSSGATLSRAPVKKLSTQMTSWPRSSSRSQRCEPKKPAPPVTSVRLRTRSRIDAPIGGSSNQVERSRRRRKSIRMAAAQAEQCKKDDIEIESQRPVFDVVQIVLDAHLHFPQLVGFPAPAAHLSPARYSGLDPASEHVTRNLVA